MGVSRRLSGEARVRGVRSTTSNRGGGHTKRPMPRGTHDARHPRSAAYAASHTYRSTRWQERAVHRTSPQARRSGPGSRRGARACGVGRPRGRARSAGGAIGTRAQHAARCCGSGDPRANRVGALAGPAGSLGSELPRIRQREDQRHPHGRNRVGRVPIQCRRGRAALVADLPATAVKNGDARKDLELNLAFHARACAPI